MQPFLDAAASVGVVLLLLALGLEFSSEEFASSMKRHAPSGMVDFVLNATPGFVAGWLLGGVRGLLGTGRYHLDLVVRNRRESAWGPESPG